MIKHSIFKKTVSLFKISLIRFSETIIVSFLLSVFMIILNNYHYNEQSSTYNQIYNIIIMLIIVLPFTAVIKLLKEIYINKWLFLIIADVFFLIFFYEFFYYFCPAVKDTGYTLMRIWMWSNNKTAKGTDIQPNRQQR